MEHQTILTLNVKMVLLNLSGGIDSAYCAYKLLKEGRSLLIHHCVLKNIENRHEQEYKAVQHCLDFFKKNGLNNFEYVETFFDYGTVKVLIYDVEIIGFLSGLILRNPNFYNIKQIAVSVNKNEPTGQNLECPRRVSANTCTKTLLNLINRDVQFIYPIINMTKEEIINDCPKDLLSGLWWCRRPQNGNKCGQCKTCIETNYLIQNKFDFKS